MRALTSDFSHPFSRLYARHRRACKLHLPWEHHMHTQPKQAKAHRAVPFNLIHGRARPLYVPHRSRHVRNSEWRQFEGPILQEWQQFAEQKGFRVHARVRDSRHLELECRRCGSLTAHKLYTLRTARPRCGGCTGGRHQSLVEQANLVFLHRDAQAHKYAYYRAKCGHRVRRQFEFVHRVALGLSDIRCEMCLQSREEAEAKNKAGLASERIRKATRTTGSTSIPAAGINGRLVPT